MGWPRRVGSLKLQVCLAKEPYKRDDILQKRPVILRSLLIVATPYRTSAMCDHCTTCIHVCSDTSAQDARNRTLVVHEQKNCLLFSIVW